MDAIPIHVTGKREQGEAPLDACRRELREEMQWEPDHMERACDLFVDGELIAWFFEAKGPEPEVKESVRRI